MSCETGGTWAVVGVQACTCQCPVRNTSSFVRLGVGSAKRLSVRKREEELVAPAAGGTVALPPDAPAAEIYIKTKKSL